MLEKMILHYLPQITMDDLRRFADENSISYTEKELEIVYFFLKEHAVELLHKNTKCLSLLEKQIRPELYQKLFSFYQYYSSQYL